MEQLNNNTLCYYCLGCVKLENAQFKGVRNCKCFIHSSVNWRYEYEKSLKGGK